MKNILKSFLFLLSVSLLVVQCKKDKVADGQVQTGSSGWEKLSAPYFGNVLDIKFISDNVGYILGTDTMSLLNILVKTTDGGKTWQTIRFSQKFLSDTAGGVMQTLQVSPFNSSILFSGRTNIIRTVDGGSKWNIVDHTISPPAWGNYYFVSPSNVIRSGEKIYKSLDSGMSWTPVYDPQAAYAYFTMLQFTSSQTGYTSGGVAFDAVNYGIMARTTNAGNSWQPINYPFHKITGMSFLNDSEGYLTMNMDSGNIARTYYGGCALIKTSDGGSTWSVVNSNIFQALNVSDHVQDLYFRNNLDGFSAGSFGIYHTVDGGITWKNETPSDKPIRYRLFFPSSSCGFAVDAKGNVFKRRF